MPAIDESRESSVGEEAVGKTGTRPFSLGRIGSSLRHRNYRLYFCGQAVSFTGSQGVGKYTLARLFAQAANCERLTDDACGECYTCQRIALLAEPQRLIEQGLAERGESADAATVETDPIQCWIKSDADQLRTKGTLSSAQAV